MTTLFISDLHLDVDRPAAITQFLNFMEREASQATALYILGDLSAYTEDLQLKPISREVANESGNGLSNMRGTVGLARTPEPHSGNAQFYINLADNLELNPRPARWGYAVFGTVVEGMQVVDEIGYRPTGAKGSFERNVPVNTIVIERIEELTE